jgi:hypothetical protein
MTQDNHQEYKIKIGDRTYHGDEFKNPKLQKLIHKWQKFNYSKFSSLEHQMEWSIMEVLLLEDFKLQFISTSNIEYPGLPYDNIKNANKLVNAAGKARSYLKGFLIPERKPGESLRIYQARVADQLEIYLTPKMNKTDASIVGDYYLARCIKDPPLGYEE